jgi:hypothetical protein
VWYSPTPAVASSVLVAPNDYATSLAAVILELSGLSPWDTLTAIVTGFANAATSLATLSLGAPASSALLLTCCVSDNNADTITGPGIGWTAAPVATATNGADHTQDLTLTPAWQVTSGTASAIYSSSGSQDLAGLAAGLLVTGTAPAAPSQRWPLVRMQAAFGAGAVTPWDALTWQDITPRYVGMSGSRGKQYELDTIQAGTTNWTLRNNDGALTPGYAPSPFFPGVQVFTPVRLLVTWPPPPSASAKTYCVTRGFMERWPQSLTPARYQMANAVSADVWALLTSAMLTIARAEMLIDNPSGCWPLSDPAGSLAASDIAGAGAGQVQVVTSKYGAGTATQAFGADASYLAGDPSATGWSQALVPAIGNQGYCLYYSDPDLPPLAGGITIEAWFSAAASQPTGTNLAIITVTQPRGIMAQVYIAQSTGHLMIDIYNAATRAKATATISSNNWLGANWTHLALTLTPATWGAYVDGGSLAATGGSAVFAATGYWLEWGGTADRLNTAGFSNTTFAELAIYPRVLTQVRIISHYWGTLTAFYGDDDAGARIDRLMGDANCAFPRILPAGGYPMVGASDIAGNAVQQNIINIAESDSGLLLAAGTGYLMYQPRGTQWNLPVLWTAGEGTGEFAYLADFGTDYDLSQMVDDVTLTQLATVATPGAAASGVTVTVLDQAAIGQLGDQTLPLTVYITDTGGITDLANWIVQTTGTIQNRIAVLTLDPAANPALWPVVLSAETGQVVTVNRRLLGTQLQITGQFQIMTVSHQNSPGVWKTTLTLVPYTGNVLTADDPVLGQLTGANRLGW